CSWCMTTCFSTSRGRSSARAVAKPFGRCEDAPMTTNPAIEVGERIEGPSFPVSRESIRLFCDGSLDYNPLHLDDDYMKGDFGKTNFGGIIMHGMNNFGLITRMLTDWSEPRGAIHRRLETRWLKPVRPGDTIQPTAVVRSTTKSVRAQWLVI